MVVDWLSTSPQRKRRAPQRHTNRFFVGCFTFSALTFLFSDPFSHSDDDATSDLVSAERTVHSVPRTFSLSVLTALSRPSSEALDVQAVREAFPLTIVGSGAEPTEPDDGGNGPSEDIFHSSDKETLASPAVSTHRVGSSSEAPCPAVQNEALGDENDVPTGAIRHAWASIFLVECGDVLEFHEAASRSLSLSLLCCEGA